MARCVRIGLTGGVGSGKSTVSRILQTCGTTIIDADSISRTLTAANGAAIPSISAALGTEFIGRDGALNRDHMRERAFKEPLIKSKLQSILHPLIREEILDQATIASSISSRGIVFDIPLLVESKIWRSTFDWIIVIDCSLETQLQRVTKRSGWTTSMVKSVASSQATREYRLSAADFVLCNDTISLEQLAVQVQAIAHRIGL
jgi:dephospho-CoA kinase